MCPEGLQARMSAEAWALHCFVSSLPSCTHEYLKHEENEDGAIPPTVAEIFTEDLTLRPELETHTVNFLGLDRRSCLKLATWTPQQSLMNLVTAVRAH